jgi:histone H3/H4
MAGGTRAPSAYFIFSGERRDAIKQRLLAERTDESKSVSVADVAKQIGAEWKQLSEEEKKAYKDKSTKIAEQLRAKGGTEENVEDKQGAVAKSKKGAAQGPSILPLSLVKKLACKDEEVKRISGDAVRVIAEATGLFLGDLASQAYSYAVSKNRKNFKFSDVEHVARKDRRMVDIGLHVSFKNEEPFVSMKKSTVRNRARKRAKGDTDESLQQETMGPKGIREFFAKQNAVEAPETN